MAALGINVTPCVEVTCACWKVDVFVFYLPSDPLVQVSSSWHNQAVTRLMGSSVCAGPCSLAGRGASWWAKLTADELVPFTSRSAGPRHFWGDATTHQLNHVRALTALCLCVDTGFLGRKLERREYERNVYQSTYENKIVDSLFFIITQGKQKGPGWWIENLVNCMACLLKPTHLPPENQATVNNAILLPSGHHGRSSPLSTWPTRSIVSSPDCTQMQTNNLRT